MASSSESAARDYELSARLPGLEAADRSRRVEIPRLVIALLAVLFLFGPLALIAGGFRVHQFENRPLEPAPKLAEGWNAFDVATRYLIDRLPLREQAVHANTWIDERIFGTTPFYGQGSLGGVGSDQAALPFTGSTAQDRAQIGGAGGATHTGAPAAQPPATASQVTAGTHGWFFLQGVLQRACSPFEPFSAAAAEWERLLAAIRASGRRAVLIVAPDKSTIYPEYLSLSDPLNRCGAIGSAALWSQIESPAAARAGIIGLRRPLLALKHNSSAPVYYKTDSHWNSIGALTMTQAAVAAMSPTVRVQHSEVVSTGYSRYTGDLLGLLGQSGSEMAPSVTIKRAPGAPTIAAPTLLLGDSYQDAAIPEMTPYFQRLTVLNWNEATTAQQAAAIVAAHDVVLQTVEREFDYRATPVGFASPAFVALVKRTLAAHPLH